MMRPARDLPVVGRAATCFQPLPACPEAGGGAFSVTWRREMFAVIGRTQMTRHPWCARLSAKTASLPAALTGPRAVVFVLAVAVISGCDRSPAAPSAAGGQPVTLSRVRIDGPAVVAPGDSPRYAAIAEYSDGSSKDVTATATWFPNGAEFPIHFTSPGIAAPAQRGEALVSANAGMLGRLNVLVLEPGTFKLTGLVSETGVGALYGARSKCCPVLGRV